MTKRPLALLAPLALAGALAACGQPASDTAATAEAITTDAASDVGNTASMAADGAMQAGGVVSPAAPNDAVSTDLNTNATAQAAGSNSFTEGQAKGHIENAGYTDVAALTKTPDGFWTGSAMKNGQPVQVSVDFKGAVSAK